MGALAAQDCGTKEKENGCCQDLGPRDLVMDATQNRKKKVVSKTK